MGRPNSLGNAELVKTMQDIAFMGMDDAKKRRDMWDYDTPKERSQQIQLSISGQAGTVVAWSSPIPFAFDILMHCAPGNRDSTLIKPHFTYGVVLTTPTPVIVTALVQSWEQDGNLTISGGVLVYGAWAPDATELVPYNGSLHLNFQGYGCAPDVDATSLEDDLGTLSGAPSPVTGGDDS